MHRVLQLLVLSLALTSHSSTHSIAKLTPVCIVLHWAIARLPDLLLQTEAKFTVAVFDLKPIDRPQVSTGDEVDPIG